MNNTFPTFNSQKALSQAVSRLYELAKDAGLSNRSEAQEMLAQVLGAPNYNVLVAQTPKHPKKTPTEITVVDPQTGQRLGLFDNPMRLNDFAGLVKAIPETHTCELLSDVYCIDDRVGDAPNYLAVTLNPELIQELFEIFVEVKEGNFAKSGTLLRVTKAWSGKGVWKESHGCHDLDFVSNLMKEKGTDALKALCHSGIESYARDKAQEEDHNNAQESSVSMEKTTLEVSVEGKFRLSGCPRRWDETLRCYTPWIPLSMLKEDFLYADVRHPAFN